MVIITHLFSCIIIALALSIPSYVRAENPLVLAPAKQPTKNPQKKVAPSAKPVVQQKDQPTLAEPKQQKKIKKWQQKWQKKEKKEAKPKRKTLSQMNYDELKEMKTQYLADGNKESAIKFLEKMIPSCNDLEELRVIMLELADLQFDNGGLEKAGKLYKEFTKLYPGNSKVEYASYKAILCSFYATLDSDRDQTNTKDTLDLAQSFLQRADVFTTHAKDVETILTTCRKKLLDSEVNVFNFYFKRGSYNAAQKRIDGMRKEFGSFMPEIEPQLLVLECEIAQLQKKPDILKQKQTELAQKFPKFNKELLAQAQPKKISFVNRF